VRLHPVWSRTRLKLDHPRQLALMHALVRFAHIAGGNTFTTAELYPRVLAALGCPAERYTLASLRYDLAKLRAKGLVAKLPRSRRYQLLPQGYSICLIFLKLFERVYAPHRVTDRLLQTLDTLALLAHRPQKLFERDTLLAMLELLQHEPIHVGRPPRLLARIAVLIELRLYKIAHF